MTYFVRESRVVPLTPDVIKLDTPTSVSAGGRWGLVGTINGSATISSDRLVLDSSRSYYLEGSPSLRGSSTGGTITFQWYDYTNSQYLGAEVHLYVGSQGHGSIARIGRRVATAFVVQQAIEVELRIKAISGSWNLTIDSVGQVGLDFVGYPSARIIET